MAINEAPRSYNSHELEKRAQEFWKSRGTYQMSQKLREDGPNFSFLDGPPYCSGRIHLGTAWNKIIKDAYLRYKTMQGFHVRRQAGWDTHGLPIEHKVEGLLGLKSKKEIEERIGIANFIEKCRDFAIENQAVMTDQFKMLGVWMDWDDPYITFDPKYMESCWWTLQRAQEKDLLVQDLRVITWCPRCETALAMAEIDYEEKEDPSIFVKFPITESQTGSHNEFILVWTTTPWTLPANMAVSIHPDFNYAFIKKGEEIFLLAEERARDIFEESDLEIIKVVKGSELEGLPYQHPLIDEIPIQKHFKHSLILGDHVSLTEGTGCVHTAPGHGPDDFEIGKKYGLEIFCPVDEAGLFKEEAGKYKGIFVKDADPLIIKDLKTNGLLFEEGIIKHRYGFCWRCKTPIIYLATEQWFLKITQIKDQLLQELDRVEWVPSWAGESRFRNWIENSRDWTISRQRYWGIPIPIWNCVECNEMKVIGSLKELKELSGRDDLEGDVMHRPYVDQVDITCQCGGKMKRTPDVLDVWIDSGVAGWASLYYPQEKDLFEEWYPYQFITEGHDQTRGWFYSQLGCGVIALDSVPYRKVLMHGFTLDEEGKKMSKSLGNVVEPDEVIKKYGADVLRFYLLWANKPWEDLKFNWEEVKNVNKLFNILWNVFVFASTYMSLDDFNPTHYQDEDVKLRVEDLWITSRINTVSQEVEESLESLYLHKATRSIQEFILEDLSRWYVRLIRSRTWIEKEDPDKLGAYMTLYKVMKRLIIIMAPIAPHICEDIYQHMIRSLETHLPESVHLLDWDYNPELINKDLEKDMTIIRNIIEACARARDTARYKLRWPTREVVIVSEDQNVIDAVQNLENVLLEQANAKKISLSQEFENLTIKALPNMKTLGPKLRGDIPQVAAHLAQEDGRIIQEKLENEGKYEIQLEENLVNLQPEDVVLETELPENIASSDFPGGNAFVDTEITPEIRSEAMSRELVRRIQDMRKDLDLDVEANIRVFANCSTTFQELVEPFLEFIANEVRALEISFQAKKADYSKEWNIEEETMTLSIQKSE